MAPCVMAIVVSGPPIARVPTSARDHFVVLGHCFTGVSLANHTFFLPPAASAALSSIACCRTSGVTHT
ncbi:hypothetical protein [Lysobacter gummosus]|uniref:hypothetical protein n=1 Tax=Lysobacter gummosus TaxID=262324 RepID=UPI003625929E